VNAEPFDPPDSDRGRSGTVGLSSWGSCMSVLLALGADYALNDGRDVRPRLGYLDSSTFNLINLQTTECVVCQKQENYDAVART
jgi:hypothetical protein